MPAKKKSSPPKMPAKKAAPKKPALKKPALKKPAPKKPAKNAAPKKTAKKAAPAKATVKAKPAKAPVKAKTAKPARHNSKPAHRSDVPASPIESAKPKTPVAWSPAVRAHVANAGTGFAGQLRKLAGATSWSHADSPELMGLEKWGRALTALDRRAGVRALVAAAQYGFPKALAAGGDALNDLGFTGKDADPIGDGGAVEVQILRAARWLDAATDANAESLRKSYDRTRQLHVWEEDLHPAEAECFYWYLEVGQCACAAILNDEKPGTEESYYGWSPSTCVARGLVIAARGLRPPGSDIDVVLEGIGAAIAASFA